MIDQRILRLLKTPEEILVEDLPILESEIGKYPFIQSIRALYLYGTHRHDQAAYKSLLTATAAYTTDKKILYQFINKEEKAVLKTEEKVEEAATQSKTEVFTNGNATSLKSKFENSKSTFPRLKVEEEVIDTTPEIIVEETIEPKHEDGVEIENVLEKPVQEETQKETVVEVEVPQTEIPEEEIVEETVTEEKILDEVKDVENTIETESLIESIETDRQDQIVDEFIEEIKVESNSETESLVSFEPKEESISQNISDKIEDQPPYELAIAEPIIQKEEFKEDQPKEDTSQLSFYERFDDHLPKVQIHSVKEEHITEAPQQNPERHLSEMDRLIAEVEAKMKAKKLESEKIEDKVEVENFGNCDISFAENYDTLNETQTASQEIPSEVVKNKIEEKVKEESLVIEKEPEINAEVKSEWKPLHVESNTPDALINIEKTKVLASPIIKKPVPAKEKDVLESVIALEEPKIVEEQEERPVLNVSFFSDTVEALQPKKDIVESPIAEIKEESIEVSNVPHFINTWHNWLKVDKKDSVLWEENTAEELIEDKTIETEVVIEEKEEIKAKAIETFIENNPKISKLKEETDFVVREKSENISHLMTETLAGLYVQQKLYTKAIGAYQILKEKYPEKEAYFEEKIKEVKDIRSGK